MHDSTSTPSTSAIPETAHDALVIGGVELSSRLFIGTGKYGDDGLIPAVCESSGSQVITVAMRRVDRGGSGVTVFAGSDEEPARKFDATYNEGVERIAD